MKKIRNIRGKDVFIIGGDLSLGKIKDVLIDTSTIQIIGYSITESDLFVGDRGVFISDIYAVFYDFLIIRGTRSLKDMKLFTKKKASIKQFKKIQKLPVVDTGDKFIGNLNDLLFNPLDGRIKALILLNNIIIPLRNQKILIYPTSIQIPSKIKNKHLRKKSNRYF